jgi:hypothetical protein
MADAKTPNGQRSAIRVLALETDDVLDSTRARRGTFGDIFNELFAAAAATHDTPLQTDTQIRFVVEPEGGAIPGLEELETYKIQAVVLSGSKYDAFSEDAWILRLVKWIQGLRHTVRPTVVRHIDVEKMHGQPIRIFDSSASASATRSCVVHSVVRSRARQAMCGSWLSQRSISILLGSYSSGLRIHLFISSRCIATK